MKEKIKNGLLTAITLINIWIFSPSIPAYAIKPHYNDGFNSYYVLTYTQLIVCKIISIAIPVLLLVFGILWIVKMCKAQRNLLALRIIGVIVLQLVLLCLLELGLLMLIENFAHTEYSSGRLGMSNILFIPFYYYIP